MAVDVSTLTIDNITPEIMAQMGPSEIAAFKAKLTPEQLQGLADKFGGSQAEPPDDGQPTVAPSGTTNFVVTASDAPAQPEQPAVPETPSEQKGPITFGRK